MKSTRTFILPLFFILPSLVFAQAPSWNWAKSAGSTGGEAGNATAIDAGGNAYVAGYFTSASITFGSTSLINAGNSDIFLTKYDALGNVSWAINFGGVDGDIAHSVAVDPSGN